MPIKPLLLLCTLALTPATGQLMERYRSSLGQHREFRAPFTQLRYLRMFDHPLESGGTLTFSHPDAIKLHYTRPFAASIVYEDGKVSRYREENGALVRQPSMDIVTRAITREMVRWLSADFGADFPYRASLVDGDSLHLELRPTNPAAAALFSSIELYLTEEKNYITRVKLIEESGDSIVIIHHTPDFGPIDRSEFRAPQ